MNAPRLPSSAVSALRRGKFSLTKKSLLPVLVGGLLTFAQVAFFLLAARAPTLAERYQRAVLWDVRIFADIAHNGYTSAVPPVRSVHCNVSRLPGFPLLVRAFSAVTSLDTGIACVIVSQLAAWAFWTYAFLLLLRWGFLRKGAFFALITMAAFPFSFFLVSGMSESLFLACFLGFVYWSESGAPLARGLSSLHGFGLGATRVTGPAMAVASLVSARLRRPVGAVIWGAAASVLAFICFLAYCAFHFGDWKIYFETQEMAWGVRMNPLAPFYPSQYSFGAPLWLNYFSLGLFLRSWLAVAILLLLCLEIFARPVRRDRLGCLLAALVSQYLSHGGQYYAEFQPVARHYLPSFFLVSIVGAAYGRERLRIDRWNRLARLGLLFGIICASLCGLVLELSYMGLYVLVSRVN